MDTANSTKVEKRNYCANPGNQLGNRDLVTADDLEEEALANFLEKEVPEDFQGTRIDRWLAEWSELTSRAEAQRLLTQNRVHLDNLPISSGSRKLREGQRVQVWLPPPTASELEPEWPELHRSLGNALLLAEDPEEAVRFQQLQLVHRIER